jgi:site-specific DNA-methyltransferase (adenine-specific)
MWEQLKRVIKPNGAIVMTASQPFTTTLIASNMKMFKYCWVWEKTKVTNHLNAKHQPMKKTEDVVVFCKDKSSYYPQGIIKCGKDGFWGQDQKVCSEKNSHHSDNYGSVKVGTYEQKYTGYPTNIIKIASQSKTIHPTQKPVALMEYLIKTYTNEGETVLDFTMGSGTTGVACVNQNRQFIGIEKDDKYYEIAKKRIQEAEDAQGLFKEQCHE